MDEGMRRLFAKKNAMRKIVIILTVLFLSTVSMAQDWKTTDKKVNLLFGLNQPLLGGFNVEGNFVYKRFIFDYSHGVSLNFDNDILVDEAKDQQLAILIPYTTGLGIGYRLTEVLNIRLEPKWHKFEVYLDGDDQNSANRLFDYNTFTLGVGAYALLRPFKNKQNALKGLLVTPSVRFWPRISSTLDDDEIIYFNERTDRLEVHEAQEVGISNSPLILNISVGYSFDLGKKR